MGCCSRSVFLWCHALKWQIYYTILFVSKKLSHGSCSGFVCSICHNSHPSWLIWTQYWYHQTLQPHHQRSENRLESTFHESREEISNLPKRCYCHTLSHGTYSPISSQNELIEQLQRRGREHSSWTQWPGPNQVLKRVNADFCSSFLNNYDTPIVIDFCCMS